MNPKIPTKIKDDFCLSAVAVDEGRRGVVRAVTAYRDRYGYTLDFDVMQMYRDFSDLSRIEQDAHPRISARSIRHYCEAVEGLSDELYEFFERQILSFDHCAADKKLSRENGLERGYCLTWALAPYEEGRRPHSAEKMIAHFAKDNGKDMDTIYAGKWRVRVAALKETPIPSYVDRPTREGILLHVTALEELWQHLDNARQEIASGEAVE